MIDYAWLIPLFPLVSFLLLIIFGKKIREGSSVLSIFFVFLSFIFAVLVLIERFTTVPVKHKWVWLRAGDIDISFGFEVTALGALMLFIVTLVSLLVHVYSKGYMKGEERLPTFYAYLGLFTFAMLGLVISPNLLQLYIFWELVGLGSFLLIGFYFFKEEAKAAAKKAFIMTRIGDVGLFIGMILIFWHAGSFEYDAIFRAIHTGGSYPYDDYNNSDINFYWCNGEIRSVPASYVVTGCDGRADACFGTYSCGDDGSSWRIFSGNDVSVIFSKCGGDADGSNCGSLHCNLCSFHRSCANGYKESTCLFYS